MNRLYAGVLLAGLLSLIAACEGKIGVPPSSASCDLTISPTAQTAPRAGGGFRAMVTSACTWTATAEAPWITISAAQGVNDGPVTYTVQPNPREEVRQGRVRVSDQILVVTQMGVEEPTPPPAPITSTD